MLLGHESTCSPSLTGVAPMPPLKNSTVVYGLPSSRVPDWLSAHSGEPTPAITRSGITWGSAPRTRAGTEWPVVARLTPAGGNLGVSREPSGARPLIGPFKPSLFRKPRRGGP